MRCEATVRTPEMIEVDLDKTGGSAVRFRREYLAIDRPIPGFDHRNGGGGLKLGGSNVTIRRADVESWGEPQQQSLFKPVGQTVAIGIHVAAVGNAQNSEAKENRAQPQHISMLPCEFGISLFRRGVGTDRGADTPRETTVAANAFGRTAYTCSPCIGPAKSTSAHETRPLSYSLHSIPDARLRMPLGDEFPDDCDESLHERSSACQQIVLCLKIGKYVRQDSDILDHRSGRQSRGSR